MVSWPRYICFVTVLPAFVALSGCSSQKVLTQDDLRSELLSANSYASEVEMFIDYIRQGRATTRFTEAHAAQLADEIGNSRKELDTETPQPATRELFESCKAQLDFLRRELSLVPTLMGNDNLLRSESAKIAARRQRLTEAGSSL